MPSGGIKFRFEEYRRGCLGDSREAKLSTNGLLRQRHHEDVYEICFTRETSSEIHDYIIVIKMSDVKLTYTDNSVHFMPTGNVDRVFDGSIKNVRDKRTSRVKEIRLEQTYKTQFVLYNFFKDQATRIIYNYWWQHYGSKVSSNIHQATPITTTRLRSRSSSPRPTSSIRPALPLSPPPPPPLTNKEEAALPITPSTPRTASLPSSDEPQPPTFNVVLPQVSLQNLRCDGPEAELDSPQMLLLVAHYKLKEIELARVKEELLATQKKLEESEKQQAAALKRHFDDSNMLLKEIETERVVYEAKIEAQDRLIGQLKLLRGRLEDKLNQS